MRGATGLAAVLAAVAAGLPAPAGAEWLEARTRHFIVFADGHAAEVRRQAEQLERFDSVFRHLQKVPDHANAESNRLTVYIVPNMAMVQRLHGENSRNIGGFYQGRASGSVAFTPARGSDAAPAGVDEARIVLFHEYAHHLLLGNFAAAYPAWFAEGYAEFLSTVRFEKDQAIIGGAAQHRANQLLRGSPFPVEKLFAANMHTMRREEIGGLYARGWLLAHYFMVDAEPERRRQFGAYLNAINAGQPGVEAARAAFGDLKRLDRDVDAVLRRSRLAAYAIPLDRLPQPVVTVRALRPGEKAMIDLRMRSDRGVNRTTAQPILTSAIPIGERYPDDPVVQGWLAEIALDAGRYDLAEAAADRALAIDPKSAQALVYKGQAHLRRAREARATDPKTWQAARSWLLKANAIDPDDAYTLMLYYSSFGMAGTPATDNAKAALARAHELVPQDPALRFAYARQSMIDGKIDQARAALRPLAYSAHAEPDNAAARLLATLDAPRTAPGALDAMEKARAGRDAEE